MSNNAQTVDDDLNRSGFAVVGKIDQVLIEKVKGYLSPSTVQPQNPRFDELAWSSHCDSVAAYFETRLKPAVKTLRDKSRLRGRLLSFIEFPQPGEAKKALHGRGKHTVVIVIREGPGFPLLCEGSHVEGEANTIGSDLEIWHQGSVVVIDPSLAVQDPAVKGLGGVAIILLY